MTSNVPSRVWWKAGALVVLTLGVFALPYFVPMAPSMSQSWRTGYNNHVALVMFLLGSGLFVMATGGALSVPDGEDTRLPRWTLWATVATTTVLCGARLVYRTVAGEYGSEAAYALDRQAHLDHGERLYRGFEYIYGPLLIGPGHWAQALLHVSTGRGYFVSWMLQWLLGTAMLWFVMARADVPNRLRVLGWLMLLMMSFTAIPSEGVNAAPMRQYGSAFLCVAVYALWRKHRRAYLTAVAMVVAIVVGFAVSPEQGMSLAVGLGGYAVLLCWWERARFPVAAAGLVLGASVGTLLIALGSGELTTTRQMGAGGYSFPVLPSPVNLLILATYVCALGLLWRALRRRDLDTAVVPLALCGLPLLTSAMGRADVGHLMGATPLFVVGMFAVAGHPRLFKGWAAAFCIIFLWGAVLTPLRIIVHNMRHAHPAAEVANRIREARNFRPIAIRAGDDALFAPVQVPLDNAGVPRWNAQSGYFYGIWNVISDETIAAKAEEIVQRRAPYLVLPDNDQGTAKVIFWNGDRDVAILHELELSPWVPKATHELPSASPIENAITSMYAPTDEREDGWWVWKLR